MMNKCSVINMVSSLLLGAALVSVPLQIVEETMVSTSKVDGTSWLNCMGEGVIEAGKAFGINASQMGPSSTNASQQIEITENLTARKVDAITIVLNDTNALELVLKKARDAGIVILTNEPLDQPSASWDIEITNNEKSAAEHVEHMVRCMGGKGGYMIYVGNLTVPQHSLWAGSLVKYQKEHYPNTHGVTRRMPVAESVDDSRRITLDPMKTYLDLETVVSFSSNGSAGAGRAVKERRAENKAAVYGTIIPSQVASLIESGNITEGIIYDPASAGYVLVAVAGTSLKGEEIKSGLKMQDLDKVDVDMDKRIIRFHKVLLVNKDNIDSPY